MRVPIPFSACFRSGRVSSRCRTREVTTTETLLKKVEQLRETSLWSSRLMIWLAVMARLAGAFFLMVVGVT